MTAAERSSEVRPADGGSATGGHFLVVEGYNEADGATEWRLEHPPGCRQTDVHLPDGSTWVEYLCAEQSQIDGCGQDAFGSVFPSKVGWYPVRFWSVTYPGVPGYSDTEYDAGLEVLNDTPIAEPPSLARDTP